MPFKWSKSLEIGDPLVDSEHRYLVELVNNLNEQFEAGKKGVSLAKVFTHLVNYVRIHFENEEALMAAIDFPELKEHQVKHQELVSQAMQLSNDYMEGEEDITLETVEFLKKWAVDHIAGTDMKIKPFVKAGRPLSLTTTPAFAASTGPEFKVCTLCGKDWKKFDDLINDQEKVIKGVQADLTNHLYNLILFDCSCGTTLALSVKELVTKVDIPFEIEEHLNSDQRPSYCLKAEDEGICLEKCACKYTKQVLDILG